MPTKEGGSALPLKSKLERSGLKMSKIRLCAAALALTLLAGCAVGAEREQRESFVEQTALEEVCIEEELVALAGAPALSTLLLPEASGTKVSKNQKATIDYSNIQDGYVMVNFTADSDKRLKTKVIGPGTEYTYDIKDQTWTTFPLADGNGEYTVKVYEQNPATGKYAVVGKVTFNVELKDEFAPFLRPNQYVDYAEAVNTLAKAKELTEGLTDPLQKVEKVYDFVVGHLTYDKELAKNVQSGYLPVLDDVLAKGKGICFDYAALMTAMLRSQGVPCKLVTGYVGTAKPAYHAWISVWSKETGWVDGAIYFDGSVWQRMDPTFASSGSGDESIMEYIGDGNNYVVKYFY